MALLGCCMLICGKRGDYYQTHLDLDRAQVLRDCERWIGAGRGRVASGSRRVVFLFFETLSGAGAGDVVCLELSEELEDLIV